MSKRSFAHFSHNIFSSFLFVILIISLFVSRRIAPVSALVMAKSIQENNIGYEFGELPLNAHTRMIEAIQSRPSNILNGGTYFVVGTYESVPGGGSGILQQQLEMSLRLGNIVFGLLSKQKTQPR